MNTLIAKRDVSKFFSRLSGEYDIVGPVEKNDVIAFDTIKSFEDVVFDKQSDYSPKKYFLPQQETLFKFEKEKIKETNKPEKRVILMRPCDANGVLALDKVFLDEHPDTLYKEKRENTLLFVFMCLEPCQNGFCTSLRTNETTNYDLLFVDIGDKYVVSIGNKKSEDLTKNKLFSHIIREGKVTLKCNRNLVNVERLEAHFDNPAWKKATEKCFSCNGCNVVCPTCYCFNVIDVPRLDLNKGKRMRFWSYCHSKDHTRVAGNYVFREDRDKRFKHRIYHKLKYFKEQTGRQLCTGCGRCIDVCPTGIDMVKIINNLKD
jgi:sulfhydrogenase subunit beta (sulfur reductase)